MSGFTTPTRSRTPWLASLVLRLLSANATERRVGASSASARLTSPAMAPRWSTCEWVSGDRARFPMPRAAKRAHRTSLERKKVRSRSWPRARTSASWDSVRAAKSARERATSRRVSSSGDSLRLRAASSAPSSSSRCCVRPSTTSATFATVSAAYRSRSLSSESRMSDTTAGSAPPSARATLFSGAMDRLASAAATSRCTSGLSERAARMRGSIALLLITSTRT
mmetsp:Transcript_9106/g.35622  ORF Transcript_9106/g.35622 Transcript_9106/m.35622 type:complete len:224 (-) Transcript_9106:2482-3153(-)